MNSGNELLDNQKKHLFGKNNQGFWIEKYSYLSVCCLAVSVNLGVACVSISTLLVLVAFLLTTGTNFSCFCKRLSSHKSPLSLRFIYAALIWFFVSIIWTQVTYLEALIQIMRYSRILIIPLVFFILVSSQRAWGVLRYLVCAHLFVIGSSWGMWLGVELPWVIMDDPFHMFYTPFTSTLEQPIMSSVVLTLIFQFRKYFYAEWGRFATFISMLAIVMNVGFLMQGRSGYVALIISIAFCSLWQIKRGFRLFAFLIPILLATSLFFASTTFHDRMSKAFTELNSFADGNINSSVGTRLEFWRRSVQAIKIKTLAGYGAGSWPVAYKAALNDETGIVGANNPHEQFLLWGVEGGVIALVLLIGFYISVYKDANNIQEEAASRSLKITLCILFVTSIANCPLHGAGMSEFFCIIIALCFVREKRLCNSL